MAQNGKSDKKIAFTIRLEENTKATLDKVSDLERTSIASVARNYLNLSNYMVSSTNLEIKSYDNRGLSLIPQEFLSKLIKKHNWEEQYEWADKIGVMINNNSTFFEDDSIGKRIDILKGFNLIDIRNVGGFQGFSSKFYGVEFINALLYRLLHNERYPYGEFTNDFIRAYLTVPFNGMDKKQKKNYSHGDMDANEIQSRINEFKKKLGGQPSNYSPNTQYYKYSTLMVK